MKTYPSKSKIKSAIYSLDIEQFNEHYNYNSWLIVNLDGTVNCYYQQPLSNTYSVKLGFNFARTRNAVVNSLIEQIEYNKYIDDLNEKELEYWKNKKQN